MNTYALVVGIERYEQKNWDQPGPCPGALRILKWLISIKIPPQNIRLFLDSVEAEAETRRRVADLAPGVDLVLTGKFDPIDAYFRDSMTTMKHERARLFVYWSGHGFVEDDGTRIFACRDYTAEGRNNCVINATLFLKRLHSADYAHFREQIFMADVCGTHSGLAFDPSRAKPKRRERVIKQIAYFATPEGEYAKTDAEGGMFTKIAGDVLAAFSAWPDFDELAQKFKMAFTASQCKPFRIYCQDAAKDTEDWLVGVMPPGGGTLFNEVHDTLLSRIDRPFGFFKPHFLRTARALGSPELNQAQGLYGMVRKLCDMFDAQTGVPDGLAQFLTRICHDPKLPAQDLKRIAKWLDSKATKHQRAEIKYELDRERKKKLLFIEVNNDGNGVITGFKPFVCNHDLMPLVVGGLDPQPAGNWAELETKIQSVIALIRKDPEIRDFDIHFLADPPLFDLPFHRLAWELGKPQPLGEKFSVVLRHKERLRTTDSGLLETWIKYADVLREQKPINWPLIQITLENELPSETGICHAKFVLPATTAVSTGDREKKNLSRLMQLGIPFIWWLHGPVARNLNNVESRQVKTDLKKWLSSHTNLEKFPMEFRRQRIANNPRAAEATLLWDDPQCNPFITVQGMTE